MKDGLTPQQAEEVRKRLKHFSGITPLEMKLYSADAEAFREAGKEISEKRMRWLRENMDEVRPEGFSVNTELFDLIWLKYMKIDPKDLRVTDYFDYLSWIEWTHIECRNFCPYLEIAKAMKFDTRTMCRYALQDSVEEMMKAWLGNRQIKTDIFFRRNEWKGQEDGIRPYQDHCDEYIIRRIVPGEKMHSDSSYYQLHDGEWYMIPI
jgi:hypothetical protein